ncbi:MAG: alkaline phosphatase [Kiritimatiellaeota bacterium]|nr:alkaline phosphatase [Kiritimatiellota bacterium]
MKKRLFPFLLALLALLPLFAAWQPVDAPRNVIIMIPDGAGDALFTLARWHVNEPLAVDAMPAGRVRTYASNNLVTDSTAAATAMSSGVKTHNNAINIGPRENFYRVADAPEVPAGQPVATLFEAAKRAGLATGIVTTDTLTGATPAAFGGCHTMSRKSHDVIARQLTAQQPDVLLGGGMLMFQSEARGGMRGDGLDLDLAWAAAGGAFVTNRAQLAAHTAGRVMGVFAPWTMTPAMDRAAFAPHEPSLPEMTHHALRLLEKNKNGFFLMVEGGRPDHAAHVNDTAMAVTELVEFDKAVAVALQFARRDRRRLLIVAADHETGGLTIGNHEAGGVHFENLILPLKRMRVSSERLVKIIGEEPTAADIAMRTQIHWGVRLTDDDAQGVLDAVPTSPFGLASALVSYVNRKSLKVGWTTHHHTGGDVTLYAYGPCAPSGLLDNTDIARVAAAAMRADLDALGASLFVDSRELFPDAVLMPAEKPDHLLLADGSRIFFDDSARVYPNGARRPLGGLAVHVPETRMCYLPAESKRASASKSSVAK